MAKKTTIAALTLAFVLFLASSLVVTCGNGDATNKFCGMSGSGLGSCLSAISGPNPTPVPTPNCCVTIKNADVECLCHFKDSKLLSFYGIDVNLAMDLPRKCGNGPAFRCQ